MTCGSMTADFFHYSVAKTRFSAASWLFQLSLILSVDGKALALHNIIPQCLQLLTRNSATEDRPHDTLCQSISCQLQQQVVQQIHNKLNGVRGLQLTDL